MNDLNDVPVGSRWRHYKGAIMVIVGHCRREADLALHVLYIHEDRPHDVPWARPLTEWAEVVADGVTRFVEVK